MSGSFENLHVPPTLVSFAVTTGKTGEVVSPEFKQAGHRVYRLAPEYGADGLPKAQSLLRLFETVTGLLRSGKAVACYTPGIGGIAEAVMKMAFGNGFGFRFEDSVSLQQLFGYDYGAFLLEGTEELPGTLIGSSTRRNTCARLAPKARR